MDLLEIFLKGGFGESQKLMVPIFFYFFPSLISILDDVF
jgi:hypothetical protein